MSIQTGICGTNLEYTLDTETGILNITPKEGTTGPYEMDDYGTTISTLPPWYEYKSKIRVVNIPKEINSIGDYAFYEASNLTKVTCENEKDCLLSRIGYDAFSYTSLSYFSVSNNISFIGPRAFQSSKLRFLDLSGSDPDSITIGDYAFGGYGSITDKCPVTIKVKTAASLKSKLIKYLQDNYIPYDDGGASSSLKAASSNDESVILYWDGTIVINSSVKIFNYKDTTFSLLVRRAIINGLSYFDGHDSSICYTPLLQDIIFNGPLYSLSNVCRKITGSYSEHTYKNYVNSITFNFTSFCSKVTFWDYSFVNGYFPEVYVNTTYNNTHEECLKQWLAIDFRGSGAANPIIDKLYFSNSLVTTLETGLSIGPYQFSTCKSIKNVTISGNKQQTIAESSFAGSSIEELYIGTNVSSIGSNAFHSCKQLKTVTIPFEGYEETSSGNSKESRLAYAFDGTSIENLTILPSSRNIFYGDTGYYSTLSELKTLSLPDNISTIDTNAFYAITKLKSLRLPNNLSSVDFTGASGLTNLSVNNMSHFLNISATGKSNEITVHFEDINENSENMNIVCPYSNINNAAAFNLTFQSIKVLSFATPVSANSDYIYAESIYYIKNKVTVGSGVAKNYCVIDGSTISSDVSSTKYTDINYAGETTFYTYNQQYLVGLDMTPQNEMIFYSDYKNGDLFNYYNIDKPWENYKEECKSVTIYGLINSIPQGEFMGMTSMQTLHIHTAGYPVILEGNTDPTYYADLHLGKESFSGCTKLKNITFFGYSDGVEDSTIRRIYFPQSEGFVFAYCTSLGQVNEVNDDKIYLDNIANISEITDFGCNFSGCTSVKNIAFLSENTSGLFIQDNMLYSENNLHSILKWVPCGVRASDSNSVYIQPRGTIQYIDAVEKHCFSGGNWERIIFRRNLQKNNFSCKLLESSIYDCTNLSQENLSSEEQSPLKNGIVCFNRNVEFQKDSIRYKPDTFLPTIICYKGSTSDSTAQFLEYEPLIIYIEIKLYCDDAGFLYEGELGQDVVLYSYLDKAKTYNYTADEYYINNSGSSNDQVKLTGTVSNGEITPLSAPSYSYLTGVEENALNGFELVSGGTVKFIINATTSSPLLQNNCFSNAPGIGSITIPDNSIIVSNNITDLISSSVFFNSDNIKSISVIGNHENRSFEVQNNILYAKVYAENNTVSDTVLMYSPPAREDTNGVLKPGTASYINKYAFCRCITTKYFDGTNNDGLLFINKEENKKTLFRVPEDYTLTDEKITSIVVNRDVAEIETFAFNHCDNITEITILNPDCLFPTGVTYFNKNVVLRGYWDSTTEKYANEHNLIFKAVNKKKFNLQSQDHYISVLINGDPGSFPLVRDTTVLDEFFRYILPTGYIVDYEFNSNVPDTETEIESKSSISTLEGVQQYTKDDSGKYIPHWNDKGQKLDQPSNVAYNIRNFETESQNLSEKSADTLTLGNIVNLEEQIDSGK